MDGSGERIETHVGWATFGDYHHFGHLLYKDLVGKTSFLGFAALAATGKLPPSEDVRVLDDIAGCLQCPDPRVWPTKMVRIAASNGRFVPGMIASWTSLVSGIGAPNSEATARMLLDLQAQVAARADEDAAVAAYVRAHPALPGFGVHARRTDERVPALRDSLVRHGRAGRPVWALAEKLWAAVEADRALCVSFWGAAPAALLDLGFEPQHMQPLLSLFFQPSCMAHAMEAATLKSPALREFPVGNVTYVGAPPRVSPRASKG